MLVLEKNLKTSSLPIKKPQDTLIVVISIAMVPLATIKPLIGGCEVILELML